MPNPTPARLLLTLKVTVESLLERHVPEVWNVYGSLNRVCSSLIDIFYHGCKFSNQKGNPDIWRFIQGLNWLQPSLSGCISPGAEATHFPEAVKSNKALLWIYCHVENRSISEKISWLLTDREHLLNCYHKDAFLCQQQYAEAMLVCLKAVEQNELSLLADVDPGLYVFPSGSTGFSKVHRRCSSFPTQGVRNKRQEIERHLLVRQESAADRARALTGLEVIHGSIPRHGGWLSNHTEVVNTLRKTQSLPNILLHSISYGPVRNRSQTVVSKISPSVLKVDYGDLSKNKRPTKCIRKRENERKTSRADGTSIPRTTRATAAHGHPTEGQSLASFLSSSICNSVDIDRENAHFRISEAMISAIEQVKCNQTLRLSGAGSVNSSASSQPLRRSAGSSDTSTVRHRLRRRRARPVSIVNQNTSGFSGWGDRDTTTSELTPTPPSSSFEDSSSEESGGSDAEQLALSLLRQFEDRQLPHASEFEWLVSEQDAPQELLPMPCGWPVTSRDGASTALRGTAEWAPPRPQLIFTVHPSPVRKVALVKQNLRCAGCGSRVAMEYASRYRYCEYLGKYFCTGCHTNQLAVIPGRVICNWDFNRYPVSTFAYRLLDKMSTDPLFRIDDLNLKLYRKVKALDRTRLCRLQLHFLKDFLLTCRFADHLKDLIRSQPQYSLNEPDRFSLKDLVNVRSGKLPVDLLAVVKTGLAHVDTCDLCQARGFICELCKCKAAIFPWAVAEVSRCPCCGACFHKKCFKAPACPRCDRLAARKLTKQA